jgi:hypothetical protein
MRDFAALLAGCASRADLLARLAVHAIAPSVATAVPSQLLAGAQALPPLLRALLASPARARHVGCDVLVDAAVTLSMLHATLVMHVASGARPAARRRGGARAPAEGGSGGRR